MSILVNVRVYLGKNGLVVCMIHCLYDKSKVTILKFNYVILCRACIFYVELAITLQHCYFTLSIMQMLKTY